LETDEQGNIINCDQHINLDGSQTLVYQNGGIQRLIVTLGVKDLVIVDTGDVLLVCNKDRAQDVKQIVNLLKESGRDELL
jgi:mannose-1-phosphate guanylyltransferase